MGLIWGNMVCQKNQQRNGQKDYQKNHQTNHFKKSPWGPTSPTVIHLEWTYRTDTRLVLPCRQQPISYSLDEKQLS